MTVAFGVTAFLFAMSTFLQLVEQKGEIKFKRGLIFTCILTVTFVILAGLWYELT